MKLAFKIDEAEKPAAGRSARIALSKKCPSRVWRAPKRMPALGDDKAAVEAAPEIKVTPVEPVESLSNDSLQLYLNEIGQVKLLTPEEELSLAKRVKRGDKKARERMITANLRLVVDQAIHDARAGEPVEDDSFARARRGQDGAYPPRGSQVARSVRP